MATSAQYEVLSTNPYELRFTDSEFETLASEDPTRSQSKRDRWQQRFHSRWRTIRGDIRSLIEGDRHYQPRSDLNRDADSAQIADFREWLEDELDEQIIEPVPQRAVRNGRHYSAPFVKDLYTHGVDRADRELRRAGYDFDGPDPEDAVRRGHHEEALAAQSVRTFQDIEDAARGAEQEATRAYRDAVHGDESIGETVESVNDRVDKRGRYRTDLVASAVGVLAVNHAALNRYEEAGVEQVGAHIELELDVEETGPGGVPIDDPADPDDLEDGVSQQEFRTAQDPNVCGLCQTYAAGSPYEIEAIRSGEAPMPVRDTHPNCRCLLIPYSGG